MLTHKATIVSALLLAACCTFLPLSGAQNEVELAEITVRLGDGLIVMLSPPVSKLSSSIDALGNMTYLYGVFTDEATPVAQIFGEGQVSIVETYPKAPGRYDLTINFTSYNGTKLAYGMITNNASFYGRDMPVYQFGRDSVLVLMRPTLTLSACNATVLITVQVVKSQTEGGSIFNITLPPFSKIIFVGLLVALLVYLNSYILLDTYFLSKTERISTLRKALLALALIVSAIVAYMYVFG